MLIGENESNDVDERKTKMDHGAGRMTVHRMRKESRLALIRTNQYSEKNEQGTTTGKRRHRSK
jgi:hypothetical protein